jgi:hypothetical protein
MLEIKPSSVTLTVNAQNLDFISPKGYDLCVMCRAETLWTTATPVEDRFDYVSGVGQLCVECSKACTSLQKSNPDFSG